MKKFKMGPYGVDLSEQQRLAILAVIENYNESLNPLSEFRCAEEMITGFIDEVLIALECVKEPKGGF
ncbi:hypothetical protein V2L09_02320 [Pseudomonas alliivorans]|nr:hypothetical protein [Pseudomonas alliivorans]